MTYIYGLAEPDGSSIRYVGKACNPWLRYRQHLSPANLAKWTATRRRTSNA